MEPEFRRAARLVVIDCRNRVFLFQYEDSGRRWWATPGGGVEAGETLEDAAAREAKEELHLEGRGLQPLWRRTVEFTFGGRPVRQAEQYFLIRLLQQDDAPEIAVGETHRRENIVAGRWWSAEDLETSPEQVFPEDLRERLQELRPDWPSRHGPSRHPRGST